MRVCVDPRFEDVLKEINSAMCDFMSDGFIPKKIIMNTRMEHFLRKSFVQYFLPVQDQVSLVKGTKPVITLLGMIVEIDDDRILQEQCEFIIEKE
jgi:hypothetical protein